MNVTKEEFVREIMQRQRLKSLRRELGNLESCGGDACASYISDSYFRYIRHKSIKRRRRRQDVMIGYIAAQRIKTARRNRRRRGK